MSTFILKKIESCGRDQKTLFKVTKSLLGKNADAVLPTSSSSEELSQRFSDFFIEKIDGIRNKITSETEIQNDGVPDEEIPNMQINTLNFVELIRSHRMN